MPRGAAVYQWAAAPATNAPPTPRSPMTAEATLSATTATAILGVDTLWGGDVMNPSGTGRFIADSWFSVII